VLFLVNALIPFFTGSKMPLIVLSGSMTPVMLPVYWIIALSEINPYLPALAEVVLYTCLSSLLLLPLWYRKSVVGRKSKKVKFRRLVAQWIRTLHLV
jgi:signal peptidase